MAVDISNDAETLRLKAKWTARGVPESLFNAMVAEANAEYNTILGYDDFSRFSILTVNIVDADFDTEHFYRIVLNWGGIGITSRGTNLLTFMFGQVPAITLHIEVFKLTNDGTQCMGYGYLLFVHSKDEECTITIANFAGFTLPEPFTYRIFNYEDGYTMVGENIQTSDSALHEDTVTRTESVIITNT